jgi:hypothetical protein
MTLMNLVPLFESLFSAAAQILPKTRLVYERNGGDVKIVLAVLACVSKILNKV